MFSRRAAGMGLVAPGDSIAGLRAPIAPCHNHLSLGRRSDFVTLIGGAVYWAGLVRGELRAELYALSIEWRPTGYECLWQPPSSNNEHNQRDD